MPKPTEEEIRDAERIVNLWWIELKENGLLSRTVWELPQMRWGDLKLLIADALAEKREKPPAPPLYPEWTDAPI